MIANLKYNLNTRKNCIFKLFFSVLTFHSTLDNTRIISHHSLLMCFSYQFLVSHVMRNVKMYVESNNTCNHGRLVEKNQRCSVAIYSIPWGKSICFGKESLELATKNQP